MKVLVTGAGGFIASAIVERLLDDGCRVVACARVHGARVHGAIPQHDAVELHAPDLRRYARPDAWLPLLDGVDAVINCAGILRERRRGDFDLLHCRMPAALAEACVTAGVRRFVQISALGEPADGEFIASKHRFDERLLQLPLDALVVRPSVVVSLRGSYGGTSLLRALAALPGMLLVPGSGRQPLQPILLEDLARLVVAALHPADRRQTRATLCYAVGPDVVTIEQYLRLLRGWLRLPPARVLRVPALPVALAARFGQRFGDGPLGRTMLAMLERGNVGPDGALDGLRAATGVTPRSVLAALRGSASFVQDRWHARLYLLAPALRLVLALVWIVSGIAGVVATPDEYRPLLQQLRIAEFWQQPLVLATSALDLALGVALLLRFRVRAVLTGMLLMVLGYTVPLGVLAPGLWLEPLGSLLKNLPILALLLVCLALAERR